MNVVYNAGIDFSQKGIDTFDERLISNIFGQIIFPLSYGSAKRFELQRTDLKSDFGTIYFSIINNSGEKIQFDLNTSERHSELKFRILCQSIEILKGRLWIHLML